jgi:hypothetical protein
MKRYFKTEDYIVFGISFFCIIWIFLYKLFLIDKDPIFYNADRYADITYTVFSSIVAAGIFYFITIFIPKYYQIKKMMRYIVFDIQDINGMFNETIKDINRGLLSQKYRIDTFPLSSKFSNFIEARTDFINHFNRTQKFKELEITLTTSKRCLEVVYSTYYNLLPFDTIALLNIYIYMNYKENKEIYEITNSEKSKEALEHYFSTFVLGLTINRELKKLNNIKL